MALAMGGLSVISLPFIGNWVPKVSDNKAFAVSTALLGVMLVSMYYFQSFGLNVAMM